MKGLPFAPPPARVPIMARFFAFNVVNLPDWSFNTTPGSLCENIVALVADFIKAPPSPKISLYIAYGSAVWYVLNADYIAIIYFDFNPKSIVDSNL